MLGTVVEFQSYGETPTPTIKGTLKQVLPTGHFVFEFVNPVSPKYSVLQNVRNTDGRLVLANSYGGFEIPKRMLAYLNKYAQTMKEPNISLKEPEAAPNIKLPSRNVDRDLDISERKKKFKMKKKIIRTSTRDDEDLPVLDPNKKEYRNARGLKPKNSLTRNREDIKEMSTATVNKKKSSPFAEEKSSKSMSTSNGKDDTMSSKSTVTVKMAEGLITTLYESVKGKKNKDNEEKQYIKEIIESAEEKNNQFNIELTKKKARALLAYFDSGVLDDLNNKSMRGVVRISQELNKEFDLKIPKVAKARMEETGISSSSAPTPKAKKDKDEDKPKAKKSRFAYGEDDDDEEEETPTPKVKKGKIKTKEVSKSEAKTLLERGKINRPKKAAEEDVPVKRGPGRPKGSKNKPKDEEEDVVVTFTRNGKSKKDDEDTTVKNIASKLKKAGEEVRAGKKLSGLSKKLASRR